MKNKKNKNAGSSMVEVLVAFLVVMMMLAMFSRVAAVSVQMFRKSRETIAKTEQFNEKYYKKTEIEKRQDIGSMLVLEVNGDEIPLPKGKLQKYTDGESQMVRYSIAVEAADDGE